MKMSAFNFTAILISIFALGFTLYSFWWMNWRKGKLHVSPPRSYAANGSLKNKLTIQIPLTFFNDGPTPIVIQNMQLIIQDERSLRPLVFTATVDKLASDEGKAFATQIPVLGREAILLICWFMRDPGELLFETKSYTLELQAILDEREVWSEIARFPLHVNDNAIRSINRQFVAHDNVQPG